MKPKTLAIIVVGVIVAVGAVAFLATQQDSQDSTNNAQQTSNTNSETAQAKDNDNISSNVSEAKEISINDVATHNSTEDCWTVIEGSVYDITEYIPRHPGGEDVVLACGTDGTSLFNSRTTEDGQVVGSGRPHSSKAQSQLDQYKIGDLSEN